MKNIKLENIVNELELISDDGISFLNKNTGQLFHISSKEMQYAENGIDINRYLPEWQVDKILTTREILKTNSHLQLPNKNEINEYGLMLNFLRNHQNQNIRKEITDLEEDNHVNYWQLRNVILQYNIGNKWYKYKREAFYRIAVEWCICNNEAIPQSLQREIIGLKIGFLMNNKANNRENYTKKTTNN